MQEAVAELVLVDPLESVHIILHKEKEKRLVNDATAFTMIYVWWMC